MEKPEAILDASARFLAQAVAHPWSLREDTRSFAPASGVLAKDREW